MTNPFQKSKPKVETIKHSATEYSVTLAQHGVSTSFKAFCAEPDHEGTGNDWKVSISDIKSEKRWDDLLPFFESHELMGVLTYDLQDWCRENLHIDRAEYLSQVAAEMAEDALQPLFSN